MAGTNPARSDCAGRPSHTAPDQTRPEPETPPARAAPAAPPTMSLAALAILVVVAALQALDRFLDLARKRGSESDEQLKLREEINQLLKEASSLSTPSTFAQAAKLRRLAAAKEKELTKIQEEEIKGKQSSFDQYARVLLVSKEGYFPGGLLMLLLAVLWLGYCRGSFCLLESASSCAKGSSWDDRMLSNINPPQQVTNMCASRR